MRIDAHVHFTPAEYVAELTRRSLLPFALPAWTPASALAFMDAHDVDIAVLSLAPPGVAFGDQALANHLARLVNEATAATLAESVGRFAGLAVLPLPDVERALGEVRHALDVLRLDGVVLLTNTLGRYPGDPAFAPLLDELDRRGAYVLIHPTSPPYPLPLSDQPAWIYEFPFESTRAIASLIGAGAPERWTRIRLQVAHLGGAIPFLADRLTSLGDATRARTFLRRLFYDTALRDDPAALAATSEFAGRAQIVLGSDWPYVEAISAEAARYGPNASRLLSHAKLSPTIEPISSLAAHRRLRREPGLAEWRDPDSSRGHHDFQTVARDSRTPAKSCNDTASSNTGPEPRSPQVA